MKAIRQVGGIYVGQRTRWGLLVVLLVAVADPAAGATSLWNAPGGGVFSDPDNWDGAAGPAADAVFAVIGAGAYTVTFDADGASRTVAVGEGNEVTFDLNGFAYAIGQQGQTDPSRIGRLSQSVWSDGALIVTDGDWTLKSPLNVGAEGRPGSSLTVTDGGQVSAPRLDAFGSVTIDGDGADLAIGLSGCQVGPGGRISLIGGGQVSVMGSIEMHGSLSATGAGSSLFALESVTAHGPVDLTDSGRAWADGFVLHGAVTVDGGQLTANKMIRIARDPDGTGRLLAANGAMVSAATVEIHGTAVLDGGDLVAFGGIAVTDRGRLAGSGGVGGPLTVHGEGTLAPGGSIGTMQIHDVTFHASGRLAVEIASASADRLEITGDLNLSAGSAGLALMPWGPDMLTPGNTFTVIHYTGSRNGTFGTVTGEGVYFSVAYDDAGKNVNVTTLALPAYGDATLDTIIADADLNVLLSNWGRIDLDWSLGDFTGDGGIDDGDLNVLLSNWTLPTPTTGTPIPEPATLLLLAIGGTAAMKRRRTA